MTSVEQSYRSYYPRLSLLAGGLFLVGTNSFVIAGLLPDIAKTLGVSPTDVSYSITLYALVVAVASPAVSILAHRLSRTALMTIGLLLIAAGTVLAAASTTLDVFMVGRIVAALGGAAVVPPATAAAAAIAPPERRGRAIAFVALGFTLATALGSPLGTAIGALGGWQLPLLIVAGLAVVLAIAVALTVRDLPRGEPVPLGRRFALLADPRVLLALVSTLLVTSGFNAVYIFSSAITHPATGGSGSLLALLLFVYGIGGVVGNVIAGPAIDRLGSRRATILFIGLQVVLLAALALVRGNLVAAAVVFFAWGFAAFASVPPIQHRLVTIDPATSGIAISWFSTAMYLGIAVAPPLGALALQVAGAGAVPLFGVVVMALALIASILGYRGSRVAD